MAEKNFLVALIIVFLSFSLQYGKSEDVQDSKSRMDADRISSMNITDRTILKCSCYPKDKCSGLDYCQTHFQCFKVLVLEKDYERSESGCTYRDNGDLFLCKIKHTHHVAIGCCSNGTRCNDDLAFSRLPNPIQETSGGGGTTRDITIFVRLIVVLAPVVLL
ncbi:uncharacterized protein LOC132732919 [Ruditapes philippinarum]|uniref:uncharacterized protein LOC132732919 n=1 Tax=Ruditapes philippinarum TaxID=129788 RepID=UPI00295C0155|nr:uncharacterized protein LOC132732919 [Ruditapes philippinarum]